MSEILMGLTGKQYTITDHIKSGGEGGVYNLNVGIGPELVAKIYDTSKDNIQARMKQLEQKIKYMVEHRIPSRLPDGTVIVTWPQDALYRNGEFVGYVMPKISGGKPIYMLNRGGKQANEVIPGYNWKSAIRVAANLAYIVSFLHSRNVVIGDMNSDNLLVYPNGFVVVIDTDSFDIRDDSLNIHYKCSVGTEEFLPPELQGRNLGRENVQFTKHTDEFALAVHIFQLLMNNMHPFNARVITDYKQSLPENNRNHNISVGNCPFVRKIQNCAIPLGAPEMNGLLPNYLIQDFKNTFDYQLDANDPAYMTKLKTNEERRTPAEKWHKDLLQMAGDSSLIPCNVNAEHYYLAEKGYCELCAARNRLNMQKQNQKQNQNQTQNQIQNQIQNNTISRSKPKKLRFVLAAAVIFIVAWFGIKPFMKDTNYNNAVSNYEKGNYKKAAEQFLELGDYKDSYDYWIGSMIEYINNHYNNTDETTYRYILKLYDLGYDVAENYEELYAWTVEEAIINYDMDDHDTYLDSISTYDEWCVHFKISGGIPGEKRSVYTVSKEGQVSHDSSDYDTDSKTEYTVSGSSWIDNGVWSYTYPAEVGVGRWTMAVFASDDDTFLGYVSIPHYR